jgi:hypothetical protein
MPATAARLGFRGARGRRARGGKGSGGGEWEVKRRLARRVGGEWEARVWGRASPLIYGGALGLPDLSKPPVLGLAHGLGRAAA